MKNWLGQDIVAGTLVYRGARQGDSSSFRVGRVVDERNNNKVRVTWLLEPSNYDYPHLPEHLKGYKFSAYEGYGKGDSTVDVDTVVKMELEDLDALLEIAHRKSEARRQHIESRRMSL